MSKVVGSSKQFFEKANEDGSRVVKYYYESDGNVYEIRFRELPDGTLEPGTIMGNPTR